MRIVIDDTCVNFAQIRVCSLDSLWELFALVWAHHFCHVINHVSHAWARLVIHSLSWQFPERLRCSSCHRWSLHDLIHWQARMMPWKLFRLVSLIWALRHNVALVVSRTLHSLLGRVNVSVVGQILNYVVLLRWEFGYRHKGSSFIAVTNVLDVDLIKRPDIVIVFSTRFLQS